MEMTAFFVSHSHIDAVWCNQFVNSLKMQGVNIWYDNQGLFIGDEWVKKIEEELQRRDVFLLVISPESWISPWVQKELSLALALKKRIVGVIHRPTALSGFILTYQLFDATDLLPSQAAITVMQNPNAFSIQKPILMVGNISDEWTSIDWRRAKGVLTITFSIKDYHVFRREVLTGRLMVTNTSLYLDNILIHQFLYRFGTSAIPGANFDFIVDGMQAKYYLLAKEIDGNKYEFIKIGDKKIYER